jgi:hypothetical protein
MKTKKRLLTIALTTFIIFMLTAMNSQSQIHFEGLYSQGEGGVGWNADGTGPEPAATGHQVPFTGFGNQFYYAATIDYITGNADDAGFHLQSGMTGFPEFEAALASYGYTPEQVKVKNGLFSVGDDIEGIDWLVIDNMHYSNYYGISYIFELDGEIMLTGSIAYINYSISNSGSEWFGECAYSKPADASGLSSVGVQNVAAAFLADLQGDEIRLTYNLNYAGNLPYTNGRTGAYYNVINGTMEKGLPNIPFQGLAADHQGIAFWDSDGTGPEPLRNGHLDFPYYSASVDYDGIEPDSNAALGHFLEGSEGFINFYLQMEYRGYTPEQIKMKSGISDLDEDIKGEDWFGSDTLNYYHSQVTVELDGESVIGFMVDTLVGINMEEWNLNASSSIVYNASENSSNDIQIIADAFFKDMESRNLNLNYVISQQVTFSGNGRSGSYFQIDNGNINAKESNCTRVYEGDVSGTWMASCSPYIIEGDITVPNGETLTIEPGVWIKSQEGAKIDIKGRVVAQGNNSNTGGIVFTAVNPDAGWGGVEFFNTSTTNDSSSFSNSLFEYGYGQGGLQGQNSGGAVIAKFFSKLLFDNCLFRYNRADKAGSLPPSGGAIGLWGASPTIKNCEFYDNYADYGGAIILYIGSHPLIENCLFHHNHAQIDAGAVIAYISSSPHINNCTFVGNSALNNGGAVDVYNNSHPDFINCIFYDNQALIGKQISVTSANCVLDIDYCDLQGGEAGIGPNGIGASGTYMNNIDEDPVFAEILAYDYHLSNYSPCVNTGDPSIFDPDGTISDMGALYFSIPDPPVAIEPLNVTGISFTAVWEVNFEVLGYILDVATDAGFTEMVPGYDSLDVGFAIFQQVTVPEPGMPYYYRVRAYNTAGLSEVSNTILVLLTGIGEKNPENLSGFSIVPNPVINSGNITFSLKEASGVQIEIFNYTGQKVLSLEPENHQEGVVRIPVNFDLLPSGTYVCRISTDKSVHTTKFIKY